jgi:hypothetical protein
VHTITPHEDLVEIRDRAMQCRIYPTFKPMACDQEFFPSCSERYNPRLPSKIGRHKSINTTGHENVTDRVFAAPDNFVRAR